MWLSKAVANIGIQRKKLVSSRVAKSPKSPKPMTDGSDPSMFYDLLMEVEELCISLRNAFDAVSDTKHEYDKSHPFTPSHAPQQAGSGTVEAGVSAPVSGPDSFWIGGEAHDHTSLFDPDMPTAASRLLHNPLATHVVNLPEVKYPHFHPPNHTHKVSPVMGEVKLQKSSDSMDSMGNDSMLSAPSLPSLGTIQAVSALPPEVSMHAVAERLFNSTEQYPSAEEQELNDDDSNVSLTVDQMTYAERLQVMIMQLQIE